jgi:hypothetical protein
VSVVLRTIGEGLSRVTSRIFIPNRQLLVPDSHIGNRKGQTLLAENGNRKERLQNYKFNYKKQTMATEMNREINIQQN